MNKSLVGGGGGSVNNFRVTLVLLFSSSSFPPFFLVFFSVTEFWMNSRTRKRWKWFGCRRLGTKWPRKPAAPVCRVMLTVDCFSFLFFFLRFFYSKIFLFFGIKVSEANPDVLLAIPSEDCFFYVLLDLASPNLPIPVHDLPFFKKMRPCSGASRYSTRKFLEIFVNAGSAVPVRGSVDQRTFYPLYEWDTLNQLCARLSRLMILTSCLCYSYQPFCFSPCWKLLRSVELYLESFNFTFNVPNVLIFDACSILVTRSVSQKWRSYLERWCRLRKCSDDWIRWSSALYICMRCPAHRRTVRPSSRSWTLPARKPQSILSTEW